MDSQGRKILGEANQTREAGDFLKSLQLNDEAMIAFQKDGDLLSFAESLADRSITLRHLHESSNDKSFLLLARAEMEAAVEIAKTSGDKTALALPLFNLAKVYEALGDYPKSVVTYQQAVENMENNPPQTHNRPSVLLDMKIHLYHAQYKNGDKSALKRMEQATQQLAQTDEISQYNKDVWLSGAHMRIANMLKADDPQKSKEHLQKAQEIIDGNTELKLRKQQWEKLAATF